MKIIKNEKLIARNSKIVNYISTAGMIIFLAYLFITVKILIKPETLSSQTTLLSFGLLVLSFIFIQISSYLGPRFGKSPRIDEKLDASLKGLHSDNTLFHYTTPVSHLLVGPAGIWVILPYFQNGKVEYSKNRWRQPGGTFSQKYMRILGFDRLGRPDNDANSEVNLLNKLFSKKNIDINSSDIQAVLVFTSDDLELEASDSPVPAMKLKQLKEFLRQKTKERGVPNIQMAAINKLLGSEQ